MGFPRREFWSGLPFPSPGDLPNPGMEPASPSLAGEFFTAKPPCYMAYTHIYIWYIWWYNMYIVIKMIATINGINTSITSISLFLSCGENTEYHNKFQACNTVLLTIVIMLYINFPELTYLQLKVCSTFSTPPDPCNYCSILWFISSTFLYKWEHPVFFFLFLACFT